MGKQIKGWAPPDEDEIIDPNPKKNSDSSVWLAPDDDEVVEVKKKDQPVSQNSDVGTSTPTSTESVSPLPPDIKPSAASTTNKIGFGDAIKLAWENLVTDYNTPETEKKPDDPFVNAIKRGWNLGNQAEIINPYSGKLPVSKIKELAETQRKSSTLPASKEYQDFSGAKSFGEALTTLSKNPATIIAELTAESLSSMANYGASRVGAGAGMGAAAGSVVPGIGTAAGAGAGIIVGLADTSLALEYSSKFMDTLKEQGVDVTDPKSLEKAFSDDTIMSKARNSALKKSIPIAVFDLISGGIAGKILTKPAKSIAAKLATSAGELGIQAAMGGAGELAGQAVSGEKIQPGAIVAEMIGELGTTPVEVVSNTIGQAKDVMKSPEQVVAESSEGIDSKDLTKINQVADQIQAKVDEKVTNESPAADVQALKETPPVVAQNLEAKPEETLTIQPNEERRQKGRQGETLLNSEEEAGTPAIPMTITEIDIPSYDDQGNEIGTKKANEFNFQDSSGTAKGTIVGDAASLQEIYASTDEEGKPKKGGGLYQKVITELQNQGINKIVVGAQSPATSSVLKKMVDRGVLSVDPTGDIEIQGKTINSRFNIIQKTNESVSQPTTTDVSGQQPDISGVSVDASTVGSTQSTKQQSPSVDDNSQVPPAITDGVPEQSTEGPIYNNSAIYTGYVEETRANIIPELSYEGRQVNTISNDRTITEAKRIVQSHTPEQVEQTTFDQTNDMQPALRRTTALELAKKYRADGDRASAQRVFDKYRSLGTEAAQSLQAGIIAQQDPLIQTMAIVAENNDEVETIRKEVQPDGQTTGKKLDTTRKQIDDLSKKFGIEVSESESLDTLLTKILAKGIPKSERLNIARKRAKDAGDNLKKLWASAQNVGIIFDPKSTARNQVRIQKALIEYISARINETVLEVGEKASDISKRVIDQVRKFLKGIGMEIRDEDLSKMIADQLGVVEEVNSRYTPPVTESERNNAVNKIKQLFLGVGKAGNQASPAVQEFYQRMVKKMSAVPVAKIKSAQDALSEVTSNLDKYADVLQGVKDEMQSEGIDVSDVNSIFDLPYFEKQIQNKVLIADIKNLITQHYSVQQGVNESIAQQLISQYNLSGVDAATVQRLVNTEFSAKMKDATDKALQNLYNKDKSRLKKPRVNPKTDADKIIEALNMGAFDDEMYSQLVAQKFGIYEFSKDDVQQLENFAERISSLPKGELRNKAISNLNTYLEGLKDKNMASKIYAGVKGLWVTSALSGPTTTARMIKGGFLTAPLHVTQAMAANLRATTTSFRALNALYRGFQSSGPGTFMHMLRTGDNPFGNSDPRAEGYWDKIRNTSFRKILNSEKTTTQKSADLAAKTWSQLLFYPVNFAAGIEAVLFRYPIKELESYYHIYNQMVEKGMSPKEKEFWSAVDKSLAIDPITIDAAEAQLEQELAANKEKLPQGYEQRRLQEIIDSKRDENTVKYAIEKANTAALMNNPGGLGGAFVRSVKTLGGVKDGVSAPEAVFRFLLTLPFTFARVAVNQINSSVQYFPIAGYLYNNSNTVWEKGNINQKSERPKTPDEKRRIIAAQIMGTMVTGALLTTLFNWEWDDDDDKLLPTPSINEDSKIQVTGLGLGANRYQENRDIDPGYKEMSIRYRKSDGSYSDWYSYRDSPLGMIMYGFGQMSDEMRFKDFKKKTDETERSTNALLLTVGNQAWNFAVSQSFQQGIKNIMDVMSFEGTDSGMDKAMKAAVSPIKPLLFPNLYKQIYQQTQAFVEIPDKKARSIPEQLTKDIPLVDGYVQGDKYDQLGYPIIRKFDIPLVPDYLLNALKENRDYREKKSEWKLVFKYPEVTLGNRFRAPEELKKEDMFGLDRIFKLKPEFIKLTKEQKDTYEKDAGIYLRQFINRDYSRLNRLTAEDLQTELNTLKTKATQKAKSDIVGRSIKKKSSDMKREFTDSFE